jgi:hypothetical protein
MNRMPRNFSREFRDYARLHCCAGIRCEKVYRHLVQIVSCGYSFTENYQDMRRWITVTSNSEML